MTFARRRKIILGIALPSVAVVAGLNLPKYMKKNMAKNIDEMEEEYAMLFDIKLRRKKLGALPLVIKDADFRINLEEVICENTQFVDCYFYPGITIKTKALTDVSFERCQFMDCSFGSGIWKNVTFSKCDGRKLFRLIGGEGSKNVVFNECDFLGGAQVAESPHENYFGGVGSFGEAKFANCELKYLEIFGASQLDVEKSRLNKVEIINYQAIGNATFSNSTIQDYLKVTGNFTAFTLNSVKFDLLSIEKITAAEFTLADCVGVFFGKICTIKKFTAKNCTFVGKTGASSEERENSGFELRFPKISQLFLEKLEFKNGGNLYINGGENFTYKQGAPERGEKFIYARFEKITVRETNLSNSNLSYISAQEIRIENSAVKDIDISDSILERVLFSHTVLSGKVNFTNTSVVEFKEESTEKLPGLQLTIPQNQNGRTKSLSQ
jgi:uncharacterized protein YjbI with pentapeptide repeats